MRAPLSPSSSSPLRWIVLLGVALCAGCAGTTPQDTVEAYARAVDRGDADRAWALSDDLGGSRARTRFDTEFEAAHQAGDAYTDALHAAADAPAELVGTLAYSEYETVEMAYIDGRWQITGGVGDFFSQATPRDALRTFIRAVSASDAAALMPLIPGEFRAQINVEELQDWLALRTDSLDHTIALLKASIDDPIVESGDTAQLRYGSDVLLFAREAGRWVILDFD